MHHVCLYRILFYVCFMISCVILMNCFLQELSGGRLSTVPMLPEMNCRHCKGFSTDMSSVSRNRWKRGRLVNASDVDRQVSSLSVAGDGSNGKCLTPTANLINRERPDNSH